MLYKITHIEDRKKVLSIIKAKTLSEARALAKINGYSKIISIEEEKEAFFDTTKELIKNRLQKIMAPKINQEKFIITIKQISIMSQAGLSLSTILHQTIESTDDERIKYIFKYALDKINSGSSLSSALEKFREEVGNTTISMIELGEKTGNIGENLNKLAEILQSVKDNKDKLKKSIRYPLITFISIAIAFIIMMVFVVPKFKAIFDKFDANKLPFPTKILLALEHFFTNYGIIFAVIVFISFFIIRINYHKNEYFKLNFDKMLLKVYLIGNISQLAYLSRFNFVFSELVKSGLPLISAIQVSVGIIENSYMKSRITESITLIEQGQSLTNALKYSLMYDSISLQMIFAGESSGQLDEMLKHSAEYYGMKFNNIVDNISAYIEPILIGFASLMVGFLALGIFMPMWDLAGVMRK